MAESPGGHFSVHSFNGRLNANTTSSNNETLCLVIEGSENMNYYKAGTETWRF